MKVFKHALGQGAYILPNGWYYMAPGDIREYRTDVPFPSDEAIEQAKASIYPGSNECYCSVCNVNFSLIYTERASIEEYGYCGRCRNYFRGMYSYVMYFPKLTLDDILQLHDWGFELSQDQIDMIVAAYRNAVSKG